MGHYIVIGGGIAGLTAANALASSGSVTLLEKSHQLGGRGRTLDVNGYRLNLGPHALVADGMIQHREARADERSLSEITSTTQQLTTSLHFSLADCSPSAKNLN